MLSALPSTNSLILPEADFSALLEVETYSPPLDPWAIFFTTTSFLALVQEISSEVEPFVESLDDISGTLTFNDGIISADFTTPDGTFQGIFDGVAFLTDFAQLAADTNGTLLLSGGLLTADLTIGDESFVDTFNVAEFASDWVSSFLFELETTATFANGVVDLDVQTPVGPIAGSLGFAGGELNLDLKATPFGPLMGAVDFKEDAQISLHDGDAVVLDLNSGELLIELFPFVPVIAIPLENLSGNITIDDGVATVSVDTVLGEFEGSFEFGALASELAAEYVTDLVGEAVIEDGVLIGNLGTPYGLFETSLDVPDLANQAAEFLSEVSGTVTLGEGSVNADLTTPLGPVIGGLDLSQVATYLDMPLGSGVA